MRYATERIMMGVLTAGKPSVACTGYTICVGTEGTE